MFKNHVKIAFRNFSKHKSKFLINLFGLAMGLTTVILIMAWVNNELGVHRGHEKGSQIYQIMTNHDNSAGINTIGITPARMAEAMRIDLPQVEIAAGVSPFIDGVSFANQAIKMSGDGYFVDQDYFGIFTVDFVEGTQNGALTDLNSVVLSESLAKRLFGNTQNAIGKALDWQVFSFANTVEVKGVYKDFTDAQSIDKPEFLLNYQFFVNMLGEGGHWDNYNGQTFLLIYKGTDLGSFNALIKDYIKEKEAESNVTPFAQPYQDTYLHATYEGGKVAGGRINYIWIFSAIALFILLIACINFMNLTTARAMSRIKEIGVKKSVGASRAGLFGQFMVESFLLTLLALVVAVLLVFAIKPYFIELTAKDLQFNFGLREISWLIGIWAFTSLIAGLYPAVYLSKFKPMQLFRSKLKGGFGELLARKGLVIFQFSISLLLIIGIVVISRQMSFIQNQNLGYVQSQLLQIASSDLNTVQTNSFIDQVKQLPGIENASSINHQLIGLGSSTIGLTWEGKMETEQVKFENITVNLGLIETMGFGLVAGRPFSPDFGEEESKLILNEEAVRVIGFDNPVGQMVNLWGNDMEIIGVVKNFNFESLKESVKPAFLKYDDSFNSKVMVRISPENQDETIAGISKLYKENTGMAMDFSFMDADFQSLYESEKRVASLAKYFGAVAILLSCLGLFGLAAFTVENRKKEIGVRKVLGASISVILTMIVKDFILLVIVSIVLMVPLGWYLSNSWIQGYAYKTELNWWIFAGSGLVLIFIAVSTVGFQAFKAANANPVKSLSSE